MINAIETSNLIASCNASGVLFIGDRVPRGSLIVGEGDEDAMEQIKVHCRLAYDNQTRLVPGIPEAANQTEGINALMNFRKRLTGLGIID